MLTKQIKLNGKSAKQKVFNIGYPVRHHDQSITVVSRPFQLDLITLLGFLKTVFVFMKCLNKLVVLYAVVLYKSFKIGEIKIISKTSFVFAPIGALLAREFDPQAVKERGDLSFASGFIADRATTTVMIDIAYIALRSMTTGKADDGLCLRIFNFGANQIDTDIVKSASHFINSKLFQASTYRATGLSPAKTICLCYVLVAAWECDKDFLFCVGNRIRKKLDPKCAEPGSDCFDGDSTTTGGAIAIAVMTSMTIVYVIGSYTLCMTARKFYNHFCFCVWNLIANQDDAIAIHLFSMFFCGKYFSAHIQCPSNKKPDLADLWQKLLRQIPIGEIGQTTL